MVRFRVRSRLGLGLGKLLIGLGLELGLGLDFDPSRNAVTLSLKNAAKCRNNSLHLLKIGQRMRSCREQYGRPRYSSMRVNYNHFP